MKWLQLGTLLFSTAVLVLVPRCAPAVDKALLVGIGQYIPEGAVEQGPRADNRNFSNLNGPVNDVQAMSTLLSDRYGLEAEQIVTLIDQSASRDAILGRIRDELVADAGPGKRFLFYFAGHGSQVRVTPDNGGEELVETIVPADSWSGANDIPDKLLRKLFNEVVDAGADLVVIMDSCHSGGATRGAATRSLSAISQSLDLPDDPGPPLEERGVLQLLAAQASQPAREIEDEGIPPMGAFTSILVRELRAASAGESAQSVIERVRGMLLAYRFYQRPVILGGAQRRQHPIFPTDGDEKVQAHELMEVMATEYDGPRKIRIAGGPDRGLYVGSVLSLNNGSGPPVFLEVTQTPALDSSVAQFAEEPEVRPRLPQWAKVERLSAPPIPPLAVWLPFAAESDSSGESGQSVQLSSRLEERIARTAGMERSDSIETADLLLEQDETGTDRDCLRWRIGAPRGLLGLLSPLQTPCHDGPDAFINLDSELVKLWRLASLDSLRAASTPKAFPWRLSSSEIDCRIGAGPAARRPESCHELLLEARDAENLKTRLILSGNKRYLNLWSIDSHLEAFRICPNSRTRACDEQDSVFSGELQPSISLAEIATTRQLILFGIISATPVHADFMAAFQPSRGRDAMAFDLASEMFEFTPDANAMGRTRAGTRIPTWHTEVVPVGGTSDPAHSHSQ